VKHKVADQQCGAAPSEASQVDELNGIVVVTLKHAGVVETEWQTCSAVQQRARAVSQRWSNTLPQGHAATLLLPATAVRLPPKKY
jgi:hypothetical protein